MSRTYIGPFGRILPILDGKEPEQQLLPVDETRTNMTSFQLPPPERLQFGSDTTPGFTEPMRYNTISQSMRAQDSTNASYVMQNRPTNHEQLPAISQLLPPKSHSRVQQVPDSSQHSPNPRPPRPALLPDQQGSFSNHPAGISPPASYQNDYLSPQHLPVQHQPSLPTVNQSRNEKLAAQKLHPPYAPLQSSNTPPSAIYPGPTSQTLYSPAPQQLNVLNTAGTRHIGPSVNVQPQQMTPLNASAQYYPELPTGYSMMSDPASLERNEEGYGNTVKPLPRLVGERVVPGEGPSWVYEDGTTCRKVIDGERVNAQWGVTKAGKPRKRLAIACSTCREKKIKCDPAEPKCVQCEKFGRECRFTTAFRNQRSSPDSPSYDSQARTPLMNIKTEATSQPVLPLDAASPKVESRIDHNDLKRRNSSPELSKSSVCSDNITKLGVPGSPAKKQRSKLIGSRSPKIERKIRPVPTPIKTHPLKQSFVDAYEQLPAKLNFDLYTLKDDPYDIDPQITSHYMEMYFNHINAATCHIFPRQSFLYWFQHTKTKSPAELMTVYAMLALGSVFSFRNESVSEGSLFLEVAKFAVEGGHGKFSLQLIHSRLMLALYYFALGNSEAAWDYGGMAIRAASALRLNQESNCRHCKEGEVSEYGLKGNIIVECRRRTFWTAYMIDRFSGFCSGHLCMLKSEDIYLRLPCVEESYEDYENLKDTNTPYFDNGIIETRLCQADGLSALGGMAYIAMISSIWGDVLTYIYQLSYRSVESYLKDHEMFYCATLQRLSSWTHSLPSHLIYSTSNTLACILNGSLGTYVSLHALHHTIAMRLNRNMRHTCLPTAAVVRNLNEANHYAWETLRIMQTIGIAHLEKPNICAVNEVPQLPFDFLNSVPFLGYAIFTAIDILSAGGSLEAKSFDIKLQMMKSGLAVIEKLSEFWASARVQKTAIIRRIEELTNIVAQKGAEGMTAWMCRVPMDDTVSVDNDGFYGHDDTKRVPLLLDRLGLKARRNQTLIVG